RPLEQRSGGAGRDGPRPGLPVLLARFFAGVTGDGPVGAIASAGNPIGVAGTEFLEVVGTGHANPVREVRQPAARGHPGVDGGDRFAAGPGKRLTGRGTVLPRPREQRPTAVEAV